VKGRSYVPWFLVTCILIVFLGFAGTGYAQGENTASNLAYLLAQADIAKANAETRIMLVGSEGSGGGGESGLLGVACAYAGEHGIQCDQSPLVTEAISFKNEALNQKSLGDQHLQKAKDLEVELQARTNHALQATVNFGNAIVQLQKAEADLWQFLPNEYQASVADSEIVAASSDIGETSLYLNYSLAIDKDIPSSKLVAAVADLDEANTIASNLQKEFTSGDYSKAMTDAIEARALSREAYLTGKEVETEWDVSSKLQVTASTIISDAETSIKDVGDFLVHLTTEGHGGDGLRQAYAMLEQARGRLESGRTNLAAVDYFTAIDDATQANNMAWKAKETALSDFEIPPPAPSALPWILFGVAAFLILVASGSVYLLMKRKYRNVVALHIQIAKLLNEQESITKEIKGLRDVKKKAKVLVQRIRDFFDYEKYQGEIDELEESIKEAEFLELKQPQSEAHQE